MLTHNRGSAVLVSTDLERSQRFYQEKIGLTLSPESIKNHLLFECGDGSTVLIYGRAAGTENIYWKTTNPFLTDTGGAGTA